MKVNVTIDVDRNVAIAMTDKYLNECMALAFSCMSQGNAKGVALHPGMSIEWSVLCDEDGAL